MRSNMSIPQLWQLNWRFVCAAAKEQQEQDLRVIKRETHMCTINLRLQKGKEEKCRGIEFLKFCWKKKQPPYIIH